MYKLVSGDNVAIGSLSKKQG